MSKEKMYLVELKLGDYTFTKYVVHEQVLQYLLNDLNYDSIRVIEEIDILDTDRQKTKKKEKK